MFHLDYQTGFLFFYKSLIYPKFLHCHNQNSNIYLRQKFI